MFEFDKVKSQSNLKKHGIDFIEAQKLWKDFNLIKIQAKTTDELRHLVIGKINDKHWTAIITKRKNNTRIISVRRSRKNEIKWYEGEKL